MDEARQRKLSGALKRYEILSPLASGGMAELFLARATGLGGFAKRVVVKAIRPELATDPAYVQMLMDEARIASTLEHSNIVQVLDADVVDGFVFLVMEYLRGRHLGALVARARDRGERLPLEGAVAILRGIAAGLDHAHGKIGDDGQPLGIVHRDVSPSNVIVTFDGAVKVIDFGIAKARDRLTHTDFGTIKGKAAYMSPEQCRCEPLDRRSDLFSLGVVAYELATGQRPFDGDNQYVLMKAILEGRLIPPAAIVAGFPDELERTILRSLARDREDRHATLGDFAAELEIFARARGLDLSAYRLARLMAELFPDDVESETTKESTEPDIDRASTTGVDAPESRGRDVTEPAMTADKERGAAEAPASARVEAKPKRPAGTAARLAGTLALVALAAFYLGRARAPETSEPPAARVPEAAGLPPARAAGAADGPAKARSGAEADRSAARAPPASSPPVARPPTAAPARGALPPGHAVTAPRHTGVEASATPSATPAKAAVTPPASSSGRPAPDPDAPLPF
jgi:serine/threonine protein kinase